MQASERSPLNGDGFGHGPSSVHESLYFIEGELYEPVAKGVSRPTGKCRWWAMTPDGVSRPSEPSAPS